MQASHIQKRKKKFDLNLNSFFEISKCAILINEKKNNYFRKIFRSVFSENTDLFFT